MNIRLAHRDSPLHCLAGLDLARALSSEVDTGSREENASKQQSRAPCRFDRNGALEEALGG
ncbi:hypothetical protein EWH13_41810 [Bradyrhizobium elkanii]|nr:hypothetical protein EWH13_41810 [Bradyrhizobium elkanii]